MSRPLEQSPLFVEDDFDVRDQEELAAKERRFIEDGADNLRVEVDLDGTLYFGSVWEHIRGALPEHVRQEHERLRDAHVPLLDEGALQAKDANGWQTEAIRPLVGLPITALNFPNEKGQNIRPGTHDLFDVCKEYDIPITVVSASIAEVVRKLLEREGLEADVVATELEVVKGVIESWKSSTLTDDINKADVRYRLTREADSRENTIVLGDHVSDTLLAVRAVRSIAMRANGGVNSMSPANWEIYRDQSFGRGPKASPYPPFDVVLRKNDLHAPERAIRHIVAASRKRSRIIIP